MVNYFISKINENKKYIDGLKKIAEDIDLMTIEEYNQEYEEICSNNSLSEVSKEFYLSKLKSEFIGSNLLCPFMKIASYIYNNRRSEFLECIFQQEFNMNPILYSDLYNMLIELPQKEVDNILNHMDLSFNTFNRVYAAIKNNSESDFISAFETEKNDITRVLRQLNFYYLTNSFFTLDLEDEEEYEASITFLKNDRLKVFHDNDDNDRLNNWNHSFFEIIDAYTNFIDNIPDGYTNKIEDIIHKKNINPNICTMFVKRFFVVVFHIAFIEFQKVKISDNEYYYINKCLYSDNFFNDIVKTAERFCSIEDYKFAAETEVIFNENEFVIPDDFFSDKKYITESKEDEYIFSIYLSPTNDNNKKKIQALQTFINTIAENGYIEDNFNTKATFLYRITGRKLPNTKPEVIKWKDEMEKYNCLCYLVKNFEHDFLNQSKGNTRKGLYKKAQGFLGIIGNIENPSAKANDIQKTKFTIYYEQFKSVCEKNK